MTIQVETSSVRYVGNGSQTEYAYNFRVFQNDNLKVYIDDVLQTEVTDYTMTNNGDETGGLVTFVTAPADQSIILIERVLPFQQLLDLIEYDRFPAESVEGGLDYLCLLTQQNMTAIDRAAKAAVDAPEGLDLTFPNPGANEFIKYTSDGLALETADVTKIDTSVFPVATDPEIVAGTETSGRIVSPAQTKLAVDTHKDQVIGTVPWVEVVDTLPGTPDANKMYLVRN